MMLDKKRITTAWRLFVILVRIWRWFKTPTAITIADLPQPITSIMEGPTPPSYFISNGSTFSPDRVFGADLRPAAHWHDWHYCMGGRERDRKEVDYIFYRNLLRCGLSRWLAFTYFARVRFWGVHCYTYTDESRPRGWDRVVLFFSRYLEL